MKRDDDLLRESMLRYLEGSATEEEAARLSLAVRTDPARRRELAELLLQDVLLSRVARETELLDVVSLDSPEEPQQPVSLSTSRILRIRREVAPRRRPRALVACAAAALIAASIFVAVAASRGTDPKVAVSRRAAPVVPPVEPRASEPPPAPRREEPPAAVEPPRAPGRLPIETVKTPEPRPEPNSTATPVSPEKLEGFRRPDKFTAPPPPTPAPPEDSGNRPAVRSWEVVIAKIDRVQGDVTVLSGPVRTPARAGASLTWGQGLETGPRSSIVLRYADSTRLELSAGTVIWESSDRPDARGVEGPKRIQLTAGTVTADVAKQAAGRPMILVTPHGEAKILGTSFKLVVGSESTRLEMKEGKIQVTRKEDQATVDVAGGFYVVVAKGLPLEAKPLPATGDTSPKGSRPNK